MSSQASLLEVEDVIRCLHAGKIPNDDLVRQLKSKLADPTNGELNRKLLKEHTGKVAVLSAGQKTIALKQEFVGKTPAQVVKMLYDDECAALPPPLPPRSGSETLPAAAKDSNSLLPPRLPPKHKSLDKSPSPGVKRRTLGTHRSSKARQKQKSPSPSPNRKVATLPPPVPRPNKKAVKKQDTEDEEAAGGDVFEDPKVAKESDDAVLRKKTSGFKDQKKKSVRDLTESFDTIASTSEVQLKDHLEKAKKRRPQERQHQRAQSASGEDYP